jgi:DNA-binding phage protein
MTTEIDKVKKAFHAKKKKQPNYNMKKLATDAGLHFTTVYDIFRGQPTTIDTIGKLARALGLAFNVKVGKRRSAA